LLLLFFQLDREDVFKFVAVLQPRIFGHTLLQKVRQADNVLVRR